MITITCPNCNAAMNCEESAAGQTVRCYACQTEILVPVSAATGNSMFSDVIKRLPSLPGIPEIDKERLKVTVRSNLALILSIAALILAALTALYSVFGGGSTLDDLQIDFKKNPEKAAREFFKQELLQKSIRSDAAGYFWQKNYKDAVSDAEIDLFEEEDGMYIAAFVKSRVAKTDIYKSYLMIRNRDDYYVTCGFGDFDKAGKKWLERVHKKQSEYREKDESSDID